MVTDLLRPRRRLPVWTAGATARFLWDRPGSVMLSPSDPGVLRAADLLAILAVLVAATSETRTEPTSPQRPPTPVRRRGRLSSRAHDCREEPIAANWALHDVDSVQPEGPGG